MGANNGGGGGVHHHYNTSFHIDAVDSGSVRDFFHDNGEHIASSLHATIRSGTMAASPTWRGDDSSARSTMTHSRRRAENAVLAA